MLFAIGLYEKLVLLNLMFQVITRYWSIVNYFEVYLMVNEYNCNI